MSPQAAGNQAIQQLLRSRAIRASLSVSAPDDSHEREVDPNEELASEPSETASHLLRQYQGLAENVTPDQWHQLVVAAELREANQAGQESGLGTVPLSIDMPMVALLQPAARFVDLDSWNMVFDLFYRADQSLSAGVLIRNEIARRWFTRNGIDPTREQVIVSLLDPEGLEPGPAQLDFRWRGASVADTLGALELSWLDEALGGVRFRLADVTLEVSTEANQLGEAAALKRWADQLKGRLPPLIETARARLRDARLNEIEYYQAAVEEAAASAYVLARQPLPSSYIPGLDSFYRGYASTLFELSGQIRDWRVGKEVLGQKLNLSQGYVNEMLQGESPYAGGEISYTTKRELEDDLLDRMLMLAVFSVALNFATMGLGQWVAGGLGLAGRPVAYGAVAGGTEFAAQNVGMMAAEHIITSRKDFDDPVAHAIWRQGAHSLGDYVKGAGLGFAQGAVVGVLLGAGLRAWGAWRARSTGLVTRTTELATPELPPEAPFTVLSDVTDAATNVRTWQLRTIDGQLVTIAAHADTGSGYIWHAATGEMRQIINGELGGSVRMVGEGSPIAAMWPKPQLSLAAATEHTQALADIDRMLLHGPSATRPPEGMAQVAALELEVNAVADFRASFLADPVPAWKAPPGVLSYAAMAGCCGPGRDLTAISLATMIRQTGRTATIRRYQAMEAFEPLPTFLTSLPGPKKHGFFTVTFEGEAPRLFDPTFPQLMEPGVLQPIGDFPANVLKTDLAGSRMARDLIRDGFVPLTEETARLYVRAVGVPEPEVPAMADRILRGERALLEETVGGLERLGPVTHSPAWGPDFIDAAGLQQEVRRLIAEATSAGDPYGTLPRLQDLQRRVDELVEDAFLTWDPVLHGPTYESFSPAWK